MDQGTVDAITGIQNQLRELETPLRQRASGKQSLESALECVEIAMVLLRKRKQQVRRLQTVCHALRAEIDAATRQEEP